ncbi:MAG: hypothetical protein EXR75_07790 [Myxococcales bacterium]|nr:hypothetical protein [Myxococcales bacterium]
MSEKLTRWRSALGALADHELRVSYARRELQEGAAVELAEALDGLCTEAAENGVGAREALFAFVPVILDPALVGRMKLVREASRRHHCRAACRLLRCSTRIGHGLPPEHANAPEFDPDHAPTETPRDLSQEDLRDAADEDSRDLSQEDLRDAADEDSRDLSQEDLRDAADEDSRDLSHEADPSVRPVPAVAPVATDRATTLSLGERRALARRPSRALLQTLLSDPHPMVVQVLLTSSRVTEADIVQMAAGKGVGGDVLALIARRECRRPRVRLTIVQNPNTPPAVAVPLLFLLTRPELAEIARAPNLAAVVRATARELWELRLPTPRSEFPDDVN